MEPDKVTMSAGNGFFYSFKQNEDGTIGVDYFYNGQPISNAQFDQGASIPSSELEKAAGLNYRSYAEYVVDSGGITETGQKDPQTAPTTPVTKTGYTVPGAQAGGTTAPAEPAFTPTPYDDGTGTRLYYTAKDLADAVSRKVDKSYNEAVRTIENQFKNGFLTIDQRDEEIKKTRTDLIKKRTDDLQSISGYMNSISPEAIQSGQGKLENRAIEDYTTQNKTLGSEFGAGLYENGKIRQNLTASELSPYMTENSDTGNLARSIAGNYTNYQGALTTAAQNKNAGLTENASNYIANTPKGTNYSNYLNSNILNKQVTGPGITGPAVVKKTDRYGNPIDEWTNQ